MSCSPLQVKSSEAPVKHTLDLTLIRARSGSLSTYQGQGRRNWQEAFSSLLLEASPKKMKNNEVIRTTLRQRAHQPVGCLDVSRAEGWLGLRPVEGCK